MSKASPFRYVRENQRNCFPYSYSTGTSGGKCKLIPCVQEKMDIGVISKLTSYAYRSRKYPIDESKKILMFLNLSPKMKTKGGLDAAPGTTFFFTDVRTKLCYRAEFCCPLELLSASDAEQAIYCQLLCGLIYRDEIQYFASAFAHTIVIALETLPKNWQELCNNIKDGILSSRVTDPVLREAMSKHIQQNPALADTVYGICEELCDHCWEGVMPKLFPSAKYVLAIMTGPTEKYIERLRAFAGNFPLFSEDYVSSEGRIGVNINPNVPPELTTYVVHPKFGYFEFLPVRGRNEQYGSEIELKPLGLTEVEVGEEYEVVLTNFQGIYRYKLGDLVKVVGFFNSTPELQYLCRANVILSINADKTTEKDLQDAVEAASELLVQDNSKLVDYTSYAEVTPGKEHYVIFWELNGDASDGVLQSCCNRLDNVLPYVKYRKCKAIGPLELRVVRGGTFMKIPEHLMSIGVSVSQFKMPKCLKTEQFLRIFNDNVVRNYFSYVYE